MQAATSLSDQPMETDEVYPCKGCGEILEEGKAFELAGNRWHIDCFRCNTCGTLLDSDANLLLLGDGSLICNNCTYSCSACGNKIEDLAILTGDQAFCANCFKCRNCKRKIDNLRYARTSQGIFCMQCHESLMARRRKKNKTMPRTTSTASNGSGPAVVLDKSLPALPAHAVQPTTQPVDNDTSETFDSPSSAKRDASYGSLQYDASPSGGDSQKGSPWTDSDEVAIIDHYLVLPSSTYGDEQSILSQADTITPAPDDNFYMPVTLDPVDTVAPLSRKPKGNTEAPTTKDYFNPPKVAPLKDEYQDLVAGSARSASTEARERRSPIISPHIVSQQRGRKSSSEIADVLRKQRDAEGDMTPTLSISPTAAAFDRSRLAAKYDPQESFDRDSLGISDISRSRPSISLQEPKLPIPSRSPSRDPSSTAAGQKEGIDHRYSPSPPLFESFLASDSTKRKGSLRRARSPISGSTLSGVGLYERPARDDSLQKTLTTRQLVARKELPRSLDADVPSDALADDYDRKGSVSSIVGKQDSKALPAKSLNRTFAPTITSSFIDGPPLRSPRRPGSAKPEDDADFATPRTGLVAPPSSEQKHRPSASMSSIQSEHFSTNESLMAPSEEESGRLNPLGNSEHGGLFRRVSKAVRHGRSHSDKTATSPNSWKRNGSADFSPYLGTNQSSEDLGQLRNKLMVAQQKISDLEADKIDLLERVSGSNDLRAMNVELREKRTTMAFLDTQREMVIRELEVMTDHLAVAKESRTPLDMQDMQSAILRDFSSSLQKLKDSLGTQIEDLMRKKNDLSNQIANLTQIKERTYQEYETLNTRNAQIQDNTQLMQKPDAYKQNRSPMPVPYPSAQNGLGIYANNDLKSQNHLSLAETSSQLSGETEVDPASGAKMVDIRKGQQKKFNWKKGGQVVAKNVTKGFKGAFSAAQASLRDDQFSESLPYGSLTPGEAPITGNAPLARAGADQNRQWNMLGQKPPPQVKMMNGMPWTQSNGGGESPTYVPAESGIFGSDLAARCDFEKRIIPSVVSRCIEEVEARGIEMEGIYRKSGSSSQVKVIQLGFEKDPLHYDISDPDLDVHAVTSTLKQYFRKLPNPLITFEVYEPLLEAVTGEPQGMGLSMSYSMVSNGMKEEEKARRAREVLDTLPRSHRETLEFLIDHLVRVMDRESENLMTALNLAVVFAPTIMRPHSIEREMTDMQAQRAVVQLLLEQHRIVFGDEA